MGQRREPPRRRPARHSDGLRTTISTSSLSAVSQVSRRSVGKLATRSCRS
jgi:hypothetical protein